MIRVRQSCLALAGIGALCVLPAAAGQLADAVSAGETHLDFRYRYEFVDQDGFADNANASTLRGRLNYLSGDLNNWRLFLEFDAVQTLLLDEYNSGEGTSSARRNRYPVVADPDYTEANQAYLQYSGWNETVVRAGRQRILLDNQRFVGGVGWRQNEQTYDALSVSYQPDKGVKLFYAYIGNVNRIFGDEVPAGDNESSTHLLNAGYSIDGAGTLSGYHYAIDNRDAAGASTATTGLRFAGATKLGGKAVSYLVEYASQRDAANNAVNFDADYWRIDASIDLGAIRPVIGYELLSGNATVTGGAFRTPLATLHAFNGWADRFLATPDAGLVDTWIGASGKFDDWSWQTLYHRFDSDVGNTDFGSEFDLSLGRPFGEHYSVLLKAALFDGEAAGFPDVSKLWFMFNARF